MNKCKPAKGRARGWPQCHPDGGGSYPGMSAPGWPGPRDERKELCLKEVSGPPQTTRGSWSPQINTAQKQLPRGTCVCCCAPTPWTVMVTALGLANWGTLLGSSGLTLTMTLALVQTHHKRGVPAAAAQLPHGRALVPSDLLQLWVPTRAWGCGRAHLATGTWFARASLHNQGKRAAPWPPVTWAFSRWTLWQRTHVTGAGAW